MSSPEDIFKLPDGSDNIFSGNLKKKKGKKSGEGKKSGDGDNIFSKGSTPKGIDSTLAFPSSFQDSRSSVSKKKKGKENDVFGGIGF